MISEQRQHFKDDIMDWSKWPMRFLEIKEVGPSYHQPSLELEKLLDFLTYALGQWFLTRELDLSCFQDSSCVTTPGPKEAVQLILMFDKTVREQSYNKFNVLHVN